MKKRIRGLIRDLERLLRKHGNLEVTISVSEHTFYQDRPIRRVGLIRQGRDGYLKTVDIS